MRLNYRILWFEDDEDVINETHGPAVRDFLQTLGFIADIDHRDDGTTLHDLIQSGKINDYDLIVTDLNLGESNDTGRTLITQIRAERIFTEVLLYSASDEELEQIIQEGGWVERASFCVGIGPLREKLKALIRMSVSKQQDVNNTRGLFIAETIVLEKKIENILFDYFKAAEGVALEADKSELLDEIRNKRLQYSQGHVDLLQHLSTVDLEDLINRGIITAGNTLEALQSILKRRGKAIGRKLNESGLSIESRALYTDRQKKIRNLRDELENFSTEISSIRNTLAHVSVSTDTAGNPILVSRMRGGATIPLSPERYVQMRQDLHKHSHNLEDIIQHLSDTI